MTDTSKPQMRYFTPAIYLLFLTAFYLVGVVGHLIPAAYPYMLKLTPAVLLLSAGSALYPFILSGKKEAAVWCIIVFVSTFVFEALGTATGLIFGSYEYGETLGVKLLAVPPVIALNWVIVIAGLLFWSTKVCRNVFTTLLFTGAGAVLFDFVMEPVAIHNGYWYWEGGIIPLQNYVSWAIIAAFAAFLWKVLKVKNSSVFSGYLLLVQFLFFLVLRISYLL